MVDGEKPSSDVFPFDLKRQKKHEQVEEWVKDSLHLNKLVKLVRGTAVAANDPPENIISDVKKDLARQRGRLSVHASSLAGNDNKAYMTTLSHAAQLFSDIIVFKMTLDSYSSDNQSNGNRIKMPEPVIRRLSQIGDANAYLGAYDQLAEVNNALEMSLFTEAVPKGFVEFLENNSDLLSDIKNIAKDVIQQGKGAALA